MGPLPETPCNLREINVTLLYKVYKQQQAWAQILFVGSVESKFLNDAATNIPWWSEWSHLNVWMYLGFAE